MEMSTRIWIACILSLAFGDEADTVASLSYTTDSFDAELAKSNHFVMFFAPWCGHCKRLSPTWDELGKEYNNNDGSEVRIAKVDCTIDTGLCAKYDVTGYPTLKFFKLGETGAVRYKGKRDITSFKEFIEEQVAKVDTYNQGRSLEDLTAYVNKMVKNYIMKKENINDKFQEAIDNAEPEGPFELTSR
ncbi:hypothetical protein KUTeg_000179 [Tegillarca granosa]|uniref:Thioredoxin domain-containing protein n=1 Tax=Tegillarca granosa TaxID=220873 RepID=A0ABQ9FWT4_TEGGR|nr:hypothetical protein KUTeg_000179 [Tegillarca granosa]